MDEKPKISDYNDSIRMIMEEVSKHYWFPLYKVLKESPELKKTFPALLLNHEQIVLYIGKTHLAIEYYGPERADEIRESGEIKVVHYDYSLSDKKFFDNIVGFEYDSTLGDLRFPLPNYSDDWVLPTNRGMDKLRELGWNFMGQNSIIGINSPGFEVPEGQFCRIVNGRFYDADENGLKTRHIKWIDFIPIFYDDSHEEYDTFGFNLSFYSELAPRDARYIYPLPSKEDFKYSKLPQINRFIELTGTKETSEPQITKFLEQEENKFILTMGYLAKEIHPQVTCEWQSEDKPAIKPDFLVVRPNGYADIVEFKLPDTKSKTTVGRMNRETFSSEMNSYISQTREYRNYFEDPNNRKWLEEKHGIKVRYPRRILVVGRRWDFSNDEWKEIMNDYKDLEIMTFDDLIDGVVSQFYM